MKTQLSPDGHYILSPLRKWVGLFLIALGGGTIYLIPYLLSQYINQVQTITGESTTNLTLLVTVYGIISLIFYIPGGWVADRISTKTLFTFSMIGTGLLSIWYSLLGFNHIIDFGQLIVIHALFAITTVLTFWSAFVKGVNLFGNKNEQAKLYSRCDVMRNIIGCLCGFISVGLSSIVITGIFNDANGSGIFFTIIFYAAIYIITGILCAFLMPGEWIQRATKRNLEGLFEYHPADKTEIIICKTKEELKAVKHSYRISFWKQVGKDLIVSLKNINMWLIALLIFFTMNCYAAINSFGTYFTNNYGIEPKISSFISYVYNYGTPIIGALFFGWLANNKTKSSSKALIYSNIPLVVLTIAMIIIPSLAKTVAQGNQQATTAAAIGIVILSLSMIFIGGSRGIYWSTMTETNIPLSIVGISSGLISIVGFSKDVWVGPLVSEIMKPEIIGDASSGTYGNKAFVYLYIFAAINAFGALIMSYIIFQKVNKGKIFTKDQAIKDVFKLYNPEPNLKS